ncbi:MAG: MBL fold metallo-hydrolase [Gammaproteobacteria bacterium]|jgi:glyoxylase-like metal-dependent hydrolase (beta-lactamase superfamily II)
MKLGIIAPVALLAAAAGFSSAADAQGGFGPPELTLVEVRENIYTIRNSGSGNASLLVGDEGAILIDDKFPQDFDGIIEFVREVTDAPLLYVINTHLHPDHTGGNPAMQGIGAHVVASENARRIMAERNQPGLPNITFEDTMRIWLDDMPIDLAYLGRGHTDGDIVVHLPTERLVITGDLFALYGPYRAVIDYTAGGSLRDWTRTLERLLKLDFDTVIPGHSGVTDRANVEGYIGYLTATQDMVREMNARQATREEIQTMLQSEFDWGGLEMSIGLDGVIAEMR